MANTVANTENTCVIDKLVDAYNTQDARGIADLFTADGDHGNAYGDTPRQRGREAIYRRYVEVFAQFPENRTEVVHRIAFGPFVIDHERVSRSKTAAPFDVVAIYTIENGLINRFDMVREPPK